MITPRVIGFDTATKTGWAYKSTLGEWMCGTVRARFEPFLNPGLFKVTESAKDSGIKVAYIEDCYLDTRENKTNVGTLKVLMECREVLRHMWRFENDTFKCELVMATVWQDNFDITGPREDRKFGSMRIAKMLGADPKTEDEADAVCICEYGQGMEDAKRRQV